MCGLISVETAKELTEEAQTLEAISGAISWLNEVIGVACHNGKSKVEMRVGFWYGQTDGNGYLVKQELSKLGYKFEYFYNERCGWYDTPIIIKMVRISW